MPTWTIGIAVAAVLIFMITYEARRRKRPVEQERAGSAALPEPPLLPASELLPLNPDPTPVSQAGEAAFVSQPNPSVPLEAESADTWRAFDPTLVSTQAVAPLATQVVAPFATQVVAPFATQVVAALETQAVAPLATHGAETLESADRASVAGFDGRSPWDERFVAAGLLRLKAEPSVGAGMTFWHGAPLALLVKAMRAHRDEDKGAFIGHLNAVAALAAGADLRVQRRHAFALLKAYPEEYWAFNYYVRRVIADRWRFKLVARLLQLHEPMLGMTANLLLTAQNPAATPAPIRQVFISRAGEAVVWSGWEAVFTAQALLAFGRRDLAASVIRGACQPDMDDAIRFVGLNHLAQTAPSGAEGARSRVRSLVTALRVSPNHVTAANLLKSIVADLHGLPDLARTNDAADFADGRSEVFERDGSLDIAQSAQERLQFAEFLRPEERAQTDGLARAVRYDRVIERELCTIRRGVDMPRPPADVDAWTIATTIPDVVTARQAVYRARMEQVSFYTSGQSSFYMDRAGSVARIVSSGHSSFFSRAFVQSREAVPLRGHYVDLTLAFGHGNYSHFLLDRFPRLMFADSDEDRGAGLMVDADTVDRMRDMLELLGDRRQIVPIALDRVYEIESVTAFSRAQHPAQCGYPGYLAFFRSLAPPLAGPPSRRIVVHRASGRRGIVNEAAFHATLTEQGFEIVRLETMSLREQITLFSEANVIVGMHGAGFSNVVFCAPGAKLIEIMPVGYRMPGYVILASQLGHEYYGYTEYNETNRRLATADQFSDTEIDIRRWSRFLASCLDASHHVPADNLPN